MFWSDWHKSNESSWILDEPDVLQTWFACLFRADILQCTKEILQFHNHLYISLLHWICSRGWGFTCTCTVWCLSKWQLWWCTIEIKLCWVEIKEWKHWSPENYYCVGHSIHQNCNYFFSFPSSLWLKQRPVITSGYRFKKRTRPASTKLCKCCVYTVRWDSFNVLYLLWFSLWRICISSMESGLK